MARRRIRSGVRGGMVDCNQNPNHPSCRSAGSNYQRGGTSSRRTRTSQADYRNSTGKISNPRGGKNY